MTPADLPAVLAACVDETPTCWLWTGSKTGYNYGQLRTARTGRQRVLAHRLAYEALVGPIPDGLVIDHLCRNTLCVNPAHLEPVTHRENILRGVGPTAAKARQTHCVNGHPLAGANLRVADGRRHCRACAKRRDQQYRLRKRMGESS